MGADIHSFVEFKKKDSKDWNSFGGRINPGRIYGMFAYLGDVRNYNNRTPICAGRGFPDDAGFSAFDKYATYVVDQEETENEDWVTKKQAEGWIESGMSVQLKGPFISAPDWHSPSWCNADELEKAIKELWGNDPNGDEVEYHVILDVLRSFERQGMEARLLYFFDN